jgi:hypothetical protein
MFSTQKPHKFLMLNKISQKLIKKRELNLFILFYFFCSQASSEIYENVSHLTVTRLWVLPAPLNVYMELIFMPASTVISWWDWHFHWYFTHIHGPSQVSFIAAKHFQYRACALALSNMSIRLIYQALVVADWWWLLDSQWLPSSWIFPPYAWFLINLLLA